MTHEDKLLRQQLTAFLRGGHSYDLFQDIVKDFPKDHINEKIPNSSYTPWGLLEHIRITQLDILNFVRNPAHKEMKWPNDYWPAESKKATYIQWNKSIANIQRDLAEFIKILNSSKTDLNKRIPHGSGQTFLREAILIIDHTSYHLGEFSILRDVMKTWGKNSKRS